MKEAFILYEQLRGAVLRPDHPRGLVVWYHGWSSSQARQHLRAYAFARAGWEVMIPPALWHDDRGVLDYTAEDSYPRFWEVILQSIAEADTWLRYAQERDYRTVIAAGHSMGAFTALGVIANRPGFAAAVAMNGSGHWPLSHLYMEARFGKRFVFEADLESRIQSCSPHENISQLHGKPLLLLHGAEDPSVDPRADRVFAQTARQSGVRVTHEEISPLGHEVTTGMLDRATAWLDHYFPVPIDRPHK